MGVISEGCELKRRVAIIALLLLVSIFVPMGIGALKPIGLNAAADGNETFAFAESYYLEAIYGFEEYERSRRVFSKTGYNNYGLEVVGRSVCQERLQQISMEDEALLAAALSYQRSSVLKGIFDQPAIAKIEELSAPTVGALKGCKYTVLATGCDWWVRRKISRANEQNAALLRKQRREWLSQNEAASCKAFDVFDDRSPRD